MKILIADDHNIVADGLGFIICNSGLFDQYIHTETLFDAISIVRTDPEVAMALIDVQMPGMDGLKGLENFRKICPNIPVVIMSGLTRSSVLEEAKSMKIDGFFPKTVAGDELIRFLTKFLEPGREGNFLVPESNVINLPISKRELETVFYVGQGLSNKEIAILLHISPETVKAHIKSASLKLGAKNRAGLVKRAISEGII